MGFGLLFIGYLFTLDYSLQRVTFDLLPDVIGYLIMFSAMCKLAPYNKGFGYAKLLLLPLVALGGVTAAFEVAGVVGYTPGSIIVDVVKTCSALSKFFMFAYTVALTIGIRDIARETDLPNVVFRAIRNMAMSSLYYVAYIATDFMPIDGAKAQMVNMVVYTFGVLIIFINLILIFSCYMRICLEGDEDMPVKPSRFAIINRMNAKFDKAFDKMEKAGEETAMRKYNKKKKKIKMIPLLIQCVGGEKWDFI